MGKKRHFAWWILFSCWVLFFVGLGMLINCQGLFFVPVCNELGFTRAGINFYITIFCLALMVALPAAGYIFPRFNIKWILGIAMTIASLGFAAMGLFNHLYSWYVMAALRGVAYAFIFYMPVPLILNNWFVRKFGLAVGIAGTGSSIGGAIFSPLTSYVISAYGWRNGYFFLGILGFLIIMPIILFLIYKPSDIGMHPYGYGSQPETQKVIVNKTIGIPSHTAIKTLPFYCLFFFAGLGQMSSYLNSQLPGYSSSLGLAPSVGAFMLSSTMIGLSFGKAFLGWLNDRFGVLKATFFTCTIGVLGMLGLLAGVHNVTLLYVGAGLFGMTMAISSVEPPIITRAIFGTMDYSAIFAYITMGSCLFGGIGTFIYGYIYDMTGSFQWALILCIISYLIAFILAVVAMQSRDAVLKKAALQGAGTHQ
ncbi:MAG: MFS transporter [Syntrophomonadaceae bacterium]|jgi:MFS family permease